MKTKHCDKKHNDPENADLYVISLTGQDVDVCMMSVTKWDERELLYHSLSQGYDSIGASPWFDFIGASLCVYYCFFFFRLNECRITAAKTWRRGRQASPFC